MSKTNPTSFRTPQGDGYVESDGFYSLGQNGVLDSSLNLVSANPVYESITTVTLAQLNAGQVLIPAIPGRTIVPIGYLLKFTGAFTTSTDIRLEDTNGAPVLITTVLIAAATDGAKISSEVVVSGVTDGVGLFASLTLGAGVQIVQTGTAAAGGTSILVKLLYNII